MHAVAVLHRRRQLVFLSASVLIVVAHLVVVAQSAANWESLPLHAIRPFAATFATAPGFSLSGTLNTATNNNANGVSSTIYLSNSLYSRGVFNFDFTVVSNSVLCHARDLCVGVLNTNTADTIELCSDGNMYINAVLNTAGPANPWPAGQHVHLAIAMDDFNLNRDRPAAISFSASPLSVGTISFTASMPAPALALTPYLTCRCNGQIVLLQGTSVPVGGPDGSGLKAHPTLFNYRGPSSADTVISTLADDTLASAALPLGFAFRFYGVEYTSITPSDNGIAFFNLSDPVAPLYKARTQVPLPSPLVAGAIAGFWANLVLDAGTSSITARTTGAFPGREFVLGYRNMRYFDTPPGPSETRVSFEIILHERTNEIELQYLTAPTVPALSSPTCIGVAPPSGVSSPYPMGLTVGYFASSATGRNAPNMGMMPSLRRTGLVLSAAGNAQPSQTVLPPGMQRPGYGSVLLPSEPTLIASAAPSTAALLTPDAFYNATALAWSLATPYTLLPPSRTLTFDLLSAVALTAFQLVDPPYTAQAAGVLCPSLWIVEGSLDAVLWRRLSREPATYAAFAAFNAPASVASCQPGRLRTLTFLNTITYRYVRFRFFNVTAAPVAVGALRLWRAVSYCGPRLVFPSATTCIDRPGDAPLISLRGNANPVPTLLSSGTNGVGAVLADGTSDADYVVREAAEAYTNTQSVVSGFPGFSQGPASAFVSLNSGRTMTAGATYTIEHTFTNPMSETTAGVGFVQLDLAFFTGTDGLVDVLLNGVSLGLTLPAPPPPPAALSSTITVVSTWVVAGSNRLGFVWLVGSGTDAGIRVEVIAASSLCCAQGPGVGAIWRPATIAAAPEPFFMDRLIASCPAGQLLQGISFGADGCGNLQGAWEQTPAFPDLPRGSLRPGSIADNYLQMLRADTLCTSPPTGVALGSYTELLSWPGSPLAPLSQLDRVGGACPNGSALSWIGFARDGCDIVARWNDSAASASTVTGGCCCYSNAQMAQHEGLDLRMRCQPVPSLGGPRVWRRMGLGGPISAALNMSLLGGVCDGTEALVGLRFVRGGCSTPSVSWRANVMNPSPACGAPSETEGLSMELLCQSLVAAGSPAEAALTVTHPLTGAVTLSPAYRGLALWLRDPGSTAALEPGALTVMSWANSATGPNSFTDARGPMALATATCLAPELVAATNETGWLAGVRFGLRGLTPLASPSCLQGAGLHGQRWSLFAVVRDMSNPGGCCASAYHAEGQGLSINAGVTRIDSTMSPLASGSVSPGALAIVHLKFDVGSATISVNGQVAGVTSGTANTIGEAFNLGARVSAAGVATGMFKGDVFEAAVYREALSAEAVNTVGGLMAQRFGIAASYVCTSLPNPCSGHGVCDPSSVACVACAPLYYGHSCEARCDATCWGRGVCSEGPNGIGCVCNAPYYGVNCSLAPPPPPTLPSPPPSPVVVVASPPPSPPPSPKSSPPPPPAVLSALSNREDSNSGSLLRNRWIMIGFFFGALFAIAICCFLILDRVFDIRKRRARKVTDHAITAVADDAVEMTGFSPSPSVASVNGGVSAASKSASKSGGGWGAPSVRSSPSIRR